MTIFQTERYFENTCTVLRIDFAVPIIFKIKTLKKALACVKLKTASNFAVKIVVWKYLSRSIPAYFMTPFVQTSALFKMWQYNA